MGNKGINEHNFMLYWDHISHKNPSLEPSLESVFLLLENDISSIMYLFYDQEPQ